MAKKTKKKAKAEETAPLNGTEQTVEASAPDADQITDVPAAEDTPAEPLVKPSTPLAGEAELAERKGSWVYEAPEPETPPQAEPNDVDSDADTEAAVADSAEAAQDADAARDDTQDDLGNPWAEKSEEKPDAPAAAQPAAAAAPTPPPPAPAPEQVVVRQGGFMPMLLGGVVAAGLGFVAADYSQPGGFFGSDSAPEPSAFEVETKAALDETGTRLTALEGQEPVDLTPLNDGLAATSDRLEALAADLATQIDGLQATQAETDARLTELAQATVNDTVSDTVIAAYEQAMAGYAEELTAMQESVVAQRAEIEALVADAAQRESEALSLAEVARVQSAAAALIVQVESNAPYAEELQAYLAAGGAPVDAALSDPANDGLPSLESLQASYPDAARAALVIARDPSSDASDGAGGLGTFLARQLQVRSVAPREGDDPDAVLSRAEAAVRVGDLNTALTEIESLPDGARTALADWEAKATLRRDALAAATALTASDTSN